MAFQRAQFIEIATGGIYEEATGTAPSISTILPAGQTVGERITIGCTNAGDNKGDGFVAVNGFIARTTAWGNTSVTAVIPSGVQSGSNVVTLVADGGLGDQSTYTIIIESTNTIDRKGVCDMLRDCFLADTTTLYGNGKLVQKISSNPVEWFEPKTSNRRYSLFLWCETRGTTEYRLQNSDTEYEILYKIVGINANPETGMKRLDDIEHQMSVLINDQFFDGDNFTNYYNDSDVVVYNVDFQSGNQTIEEDEGRMVFIAEGIITVMINRDQT